MKVKKTLRLVLVVAILIFNLIEIASSEENGIVIDFEQTPAGALPVDNSSLSAPYVFEDLSVQFFFDVNGNTVYDSEIDELPVFERAGSSDSVRGFLGSSGNDTPDTGFESHLGDYFLRQSPGNKFGNLPAPLIVDYDTFLSISALSGEIWDIDGNGGTGTEQWLIEVLDGSGNVLASTKSPLGELGSYTAELDARPWTFNFTELPSGVDKVRLSFIGGKTYGIGLAFNNFRPTTTSTAQTTCYLPSDYYPAAASGLSYVDFGDFDITEAIIASTVPGVADTPVPLDVTDCGSGFGVFIPWTEAASASTVAMMNLFSTPCNNDLPTKVEITLSHGFACTLKAYDVHGALVDTAVAGAQHTLQTLTLTSNTTGIETIEFDGAEICIIEVCIGCNENGESGPDPEDCDEKAKIARQEGYDEGFEAGLAAAALLNEKQASCAVVEENYDITIPCIDVDGQTFPITFYFLSETADLFSSDAVWSLMPPELR